MKTTNLFSSLVCIVCMASFIESGEAANKIKPSASTIESVQSVLAAEADISNESVDRRGTLNPEARPVSNADAMWWQAGYLQSGKQWRLYEESLPANSDATKLDEYNEQRSALKDQRNGQWRLANWCRKNGLLDQERVHLLRVLLDREPAANIETVYERLGYQRIGDVWVSPQERREAAKVESEIELSQKRWGAKLQNLVQRLEETSTQRVQAEKELAEIDDPVAVPAIVATFCMSTQPLAEHGIRTLGQIPEYQASRALAGQAVFSRYKPVRSKATALLKQRKLEEFAPDLLLILSNPIRAGRQIDGRVLVARGAGAIPNFEMEWDYVWIEESSDTMRIGIRRLFPISVSGSFRRLDDSELLDMETGQKVSLSHLTLGYLELLNQSEQLDYAAGKINDLRVAANESVSKVLSDVTDQPMSSEPNKWWTWWANFSNSPNSKSVVIIDERKSQPNIPSLSVNRRTSCLVAGTPVWTERGVMGIEQIQPGDRVLSKDIETGELAYKPVLQTTERAPTSVLKFHVGDESIEASPGHHFWVSGEGWTKTRQLSSQQPMHTATGMRRIAHIADERHSQKVYNLVVADFHTYFVGTSMILSHDVQPPGLTNVKIPGLRADQ